MDSTALASKKRCQGQHRKDGSTTSSPPSTVVSRPASSPTCSHNPLKLDQSRADNSQLHTENGRLREENGRLREENARLRNQVAQLNNSIDLMVQAMHTGPAVEPEDRPFNS
ncbi:hypothetical protein ACJ73_03031 [Blastomyces percursus]|uniref:Uncharacterized protein n=1 Tax=Blastomyces percursus TaxID=1658174 RepID=A0A1J9Q9W0_9EURO|nr:hypothetical protein ACJ73_03031 [Blastomyces percursus]